MTMPTTTKDGRRRPAREYRWVIHVYRTDQDIWQLGEMILDVVRRLPGLVNMPSVFLVQGDDQERWEINLSGQSTEISSRRIGRVLKGMLTPLAQEVNMDRVRIT